LRVYLRVAWLSCRRYATYRAATVAGAFTNTIFGFIRAYVLLAVWHARPHLGGYDATDTVTYCFLGQSLIMVLAIFGGELDLAERVRTGAIGIDLYRPVDFQAWWYAGDLGRGGYQVLVRGLPPFLVGALVFKLRLPQSPTLWLAFAVAVVLALSVSFALRYLVAMTTFWLVDNRGLETLSGVAALFFSGMLLPLVMFPGWLEPTARALPWAAMVQVPADVFLGKHSGVGLVGALAAQAAWALVLLLIGRLVTQLASRRLAISGG